MEIFRFLYRFAIAAALATSVVALAPTFKVVSDTVGSDGVLTVFFDERGLGNSNVAYSLTATADASFVCCNKGGNQASASNKQTSEPVSASTTLSATTNGRIVGSITAGPSTPAFCPSGQTVVLAFVEYVSIVLFDTTNSVSVSPSNVMFATACGR